MHRLPPRYGTRILIALAALGAYALVVAVGRDATAMFVMTIAFLVALGVGGWALGRYGGTVLGAIIMPFDLAMERVFGVDTAQYWGGSPGTMPGLIALYTIVCAGMGFLVGVAADFSR